MFKGLLILLTLLLLLPNLVQRDIHPTLSYDGKERFDPALSRLNSVALLENYTDSLAAAQGIERGTFAYAELLERVIEERFYHGFSHYSPAENWIAALAGRFIKEDYSCKVDPESILQHPNAACSQQSLVMMAVLRHKGMDYRSVGFPHHYALEVYTGNEWYFFDANMEPGIRQSERSLSSWQHRNDRLKPYYDNGLHPHLDYQFGNNQSALVGPVNEIPARNAALFHGVTGILSGFAWCLPLLVLLFRGLRTATLPRLTLHRPVTQPALRVS